MLKRIKEVCGNKETFLSGLVESDEKYVGGKEANKHESRKCNLGRGAVGKQPVLGMRERDGETQVQGVCSRRRSYQLHRERMGHSEAHDHGSAPSHLGEASEEISQRSLLRTERGQREDPRQGSYRSPMSNVCGSHPTMEETERKPPEEFFKLVDAIVRHPPNKRKKQVRRRGKSKSDRATKRASTNPSKTSVYSKSLKFRPHHHRKGFANQPQNAIYIISVYLKQ